MSKLSCNGGPTIAICMAPYFGHWIPVFPLLRQLQAQGARIVVIVFPGQVDYMIRNGFECRVIRSKTWRDAVGHRLKYKFRRLKEATCRANKEIEAILLETGAKVLLVDPFIDACATSALGLGLKLAYLYGFDANRSIGEGPPGTYFHRARSTTRPLAIRALWARHYFQHQILRGGYLAYLLGPRRRFVQTALRRYGGGVAYDISGFHAAGIPRIALYPSALEFTENRDITYAGLCVAPQATVVSAAPNQNRQRVLCSLGTVARAYHHSRRFFSVARETMQLLPDWDMILHVGKVMDTPPGPAQANITTVTSMSQMDELSRATVMITHAGLGAVKECIASGVPMVASPCNFDQIGNARKITHLGIGVTARVDRIDAEELAGLIRNAARPEFRQKICALRKHIESAGELESAVAKILSLTRC
jgi:zeaxanthin glucosyltransferase